MTGDDLIVLAPWIVFSAGLAVVLLRLRRQRRSLRRDSPPRPLLSQPESGAQGEDPRTEDPRPARRAAGRDQGEARS